MVWDLSGRMNVKTQNAIYRNTWTCAIPLKRRRPFQRKELSNVVRAMPFFTTTKPTMCTIFITSRTICMWRVRSRGTFWFYLSLSSLSHHFHFFRYRQKVVGRVDQDFDISRVPTLPVNALPVVKPIVKLKRIDTAQNHTNNLKRIKRIKCSKSVDVQRSDWKINLNL